jgi:pimeloyl-ACP methyl ester carboxylesterase
MLTVSGTHVIGNGPRKVMCLHGWFGHALAWGPMVQHLDTRRFTYAFMDYRGYGQRKDVAGPYTMAQISADALTLADQLDWPTFSLLGHSMGGMAVAHVLADAPQRVQSLVAIAPVPACGVPFDEQGWAFFSSAAESADARRGIIDLTTGNRLTGTWLDAMVRESLQSSDSRAFAAYLQAWAKTDFAHRIAGLQLPVLVLAGEHDPALGADTCKATWLAHFPNAQLHIVPNAGHYPMDETPIALATQIERFLDSAAGQVC